MVKGIIIDFNGTLYLDHDLNRAAWTEIFNSIKPKGSTAKYSDLDRTNMPNNYLLIKGMHDFFNMEVSDETIEKISANKEAIYKKLALEGNRDKLIDGAEEMFEYFKRNNIPYCIASMAPKCNMDFYLDYLRLDRWFTYDNIVYDNGEYPAKNPQIEEAARRMNLDVKDCLIIEDTPENIRLAIEKINAKQFIYINTRDIDYITREIVQEIKDFTELDYKIFNN